jgi:hypothetical protein
VKIIFDTWFFFFFSCPKAATSNIEKPLHPGFNFVGRAQRVRVVFRFVSGKKNINREISCEGQYKDIFSMKIESSLKNILL